MRERGGLALPLGLPLFFGAEVGGESKSFCESEKSCEAGESSLCKTFAVVCEVMFCEGGEGAGKFSPGVEEISPGAEETFSGAVSEANSAGK